MKKYVFLFPILLLFSCASDEDVYVKIPDENTETPINPTDPDINGVDMSNYFTIIFKSPSLKNIATSAQFMHDGRFSTLLEVVEFYNSGIQNGLALDNRLRDQNGQPIRMNLSQAEKRSLGCLFGNTQG